ncbi:hypothetical protein RvY_03109 [Ramazzottius varieornatus]|uniref:Uncharacterized protein n=1 Tax=Ramazzottius varieornatus TaxID=947166 RepID=A0A1D1UMR9_RAMVA|nr:hypothetical protein RvY_03109 [Ramazzottius varieornatus]
MNDFKVMQPDVKKFNIRFRDSYNYNPQSLFAWTKTFSPPKEEQERALEQKRTNGQVDLISKAKTMDVPDFTKSKALGRDSSFTM